jgi:hypothetical protein
MMPGPTVMVVESGGPTIPRPVILASLGAAVALDYAAFRFLFEMNYFRWYLAGGPLIATVLVGVSKALDLDKDPNRVSADPNLYSGAWFYKQGKDLLRLAEIVRARGANAFDEIGATISAVAMALIGIAWLVLVAPIQYFVTLLTGAPARVALHGTTSLRPREKGTPTAIDRDREEAQPGTQFFGLFATNAVTMTSALTAALLYLLAKLI